MVHNREFDSHFCKIKFSEFRILQLCVLQDNRYNIGYWFIFSDYVSGAVLSDYLLPNARNSASTFEQGDIIIN